MQEVIRKSTLTIGENIFVIPREYSYELMRDSRFALAKSGTVTLELALHHTPSVVTYEISKTHYFIGKHLLKLNLPFYCIVNILMGKEIFPEHVGTGIEAHELTKQLSEIDEQKMKDGCQELKNLLTDKKPGPTAAAVIEEMLHS